MENYLYDAHCHIFTLRYAIKEVKGMLHDILDGTYPWHDPSSKSLFAVRGSWSDLKLLLRQLYELIHAAGGSEEENLNFLQQEAKKAFPEDQLRIIPLMMDIFFMLAYPLNKDQEFKHVDELKTPQIDLDDYQKCWNEILDDLTVYVQSNKAALIVNGINDVNKNIESALQIIGEERSIEETLKLRSGESMLTGMDGFFRTEGYCNHLNNLMDLVKTRKGELFPFIAIDPRREGIVDTLLSGSFIKGDARFYGVKLYPRMGFHPLSKPMDSVYQYCSVNNLPIITHCGKGGFPPSTTWKYADFGNPLHFEPVIKKYPDLKINFAHFGSSDPTFQWAKTVARLVEENENVYSDLSCYTNVRDLINKKQLCDIRPKLKTRLMFGTDFDVMYFTDNVSLKSYYNNFKTVFYDELEVLMKRNSESFMGL